MTERRAAPRTAPAEQIPTKLKASLPGRLIDISSRGMQIEIAHCLKLHLSCEVRLVIAGREISMKGIVRRCRATGFAPDDKGGKLLYYRAGIEFETMPEEALTLLREHVLAETAAATVAPVAAEPEPVLLESALAPVRQRSGPVKIRIRADHIRRILDRNSTYGS